MKKHVVLWALFLSLSSVSAFAQWQWLDKDGRKVFSDRAPPPEVAEKNILKRPGSAPRKDPAAAEPQAPANREAAAGTGATPASPQGADSAKSAAPAPKESALDKELAAKKQKAANAEAAKLKAEEERINATKSENCTRAKQSQAELASGNRISRMQANGERTYLDEAGRAAEMKFVQEVIKSNCN